MGLGKGVVSQTAASGSEVWKGGESGGIFYFFLRIYYSMGRERLLGSLQYRPGKYQLFEKLFYPTNILA